MAKGPRVNPGILDIAPYRGGKGGQAATGRVHKLSSNESAIGCSNRAREAYLAAAGALEVYPDGAAADLRAAIAVRYGLNTDNIVCGAGSDEILQLLGRAYLSPGTEALYSAHGFLMYRIIAQSMGATPVVAPETDLTADVDALLAAVTERTRVVFLANPNNPTGTYLPVSELRRLHAGLPDGVLLVVDAAYAEYVRANDYEAGIELVSSFENVVMTRTFSKIHGLAALRVGWAYCPAAIADVLNRIRGPFNVATPALAAAAASMRDGEFLEAGRAHNDVWRPWLEQAVARLGLEVKSGVGNFVLARFAEGRTECADEAESFLASRGIFVRNMAGYGLPHALRVTVGTEEANRAAVAGLRAFLDGSG